MDPRLIVALDTSHRRHALELVDSLLPVVRIFKIGLELFTAHGPAIVGEVAGTGARVFLDLKLHDIPNTVAGAVYSAGSLPGVVMLTLHTGGGRPMLEAAVEAIRSVDSTDFESVIPGKDRPSLLGVSVLTSLDDQDLQQTGVPGGVREQVQRLAALATASGLDGLVCSPGEVGDLRQSLGPGFLLVTPGIRPADAEAADQKRIATPQAALAQGASFLVIGRPITQAPSPRDAASRIISSLP